MKITLRFNQVIQAIFEDLIVQNIHGKQMCTKCIVTVINKTEVCIRKACSLRQVVSAGRRCYVITMQLDIIEKTYSENAPRLKEIVYISFRLGAYECPQQMAFSKCFVQTRREARIKRGSMGFNLH